MYFKPVILWTDALLYILVIGVIGFSFWARNKQHLRVAWRQVFQTKLGMASMVILLSFISIGILDSLHFRRALPDTGNHRSVHYSGYVESVLDTLLAPLDKHQEKTYSAPFATHLYAKENVRLPDGRVVRDFPRLKYAGIGVETTQQKAWDIMTRMLHGLFYSFLFFIPLYLLVAWRRSRRLRISIVKSGAAILRGDTKIPWRVMLITVAMVILISMVTMSLSANYHILGTSKVGQDIFYQTIKSIRTGLMIGTLTTLVMLPFALLMGTMAGYFGGIIDDTIQYIYTTLSSIPGVLLIAAAILSLQVFITNHPERFPTLALRSDARLLALCIILGVTSWTSLCRVLRAETLKLREMDYIHAAVVLGVNRLRIITRHILPNVMHIVLITVVLDFSSLVLAEAVLSYVGVGVDPSSISWGNMINSSRLEMAREPLVWWPLLAAFVFMFTLVLSANLFADSVRDAFDPKSTS